MNLRYSAKTYLSELVLKLLLVAVFLGCTSTGQASLWFLWFYVQENPKAQPAVVLVLKRLRRRDNGLKSRPTDWEKPGIEPATPGLQDIGLSLTPRRLLRTGAESVVCGRVPWLYQYWPGGFMLFRFYVQELPEAQPAAILVLKRLRRRGNGLKSHPTD